MSDGTIGTTVSPVGPPLLTAVQVAEALSVSVSMVYRLRREGRLRCVRIGALYRFHPDDVRAVMSARS